ncbi:MAG: acyl-CoA dehydrogenase [Firmicutes bacterium]|nr:acyl-CoA dehydrogenase [Bacillota bacterium]
MADYLVDNRDNKFICKEWLNLEPVFAAEKYSGWSVDDLEMIIDQIHKVAKEVVGPTNKDGDTIHAQFKDGKVTVPPSFHKAYWFVQENGWGSSNEYEEAEGTLPLTLHCVCHEMFYGANPAFYPYVGLTTGAAKLIQSFGAEKDKEMFCEKMFTGKWSGTMCLTEPGGGSDLGDQTTKAFPTDNPRIYKIKGTKCFITAGDHDITENIVHMVIARVDGAAPGTKGLSLFIVPKIWVNEDGSLGEWNDVTTVGIEHKMGLKGSATCVLSFGENDNCRGILLGNPPNEEGAGEGIAQMFQMMNGARLRTGIAALGVTASAYAYAVQYAKERIQGRPFTNPKLGRVPIIKHEDIRRMLLNAKALIEGERALVYKTAFLLDMSEVAPTKEERAAALRRLEVNTPLIKAFCSDMAWPIVADMIQVHGGYGFSEEYPVAQCARDVKIYSIWEGTNFIQSLDLIGRKFNLDKGRVFEEWMVEIKDGIEKCAAVPEFANEVAILNEAWEKVKKIREWYATQAQGGNRALMPLYSTRTLHSCAQLVCGQLLLDQAVVALKRAKEIGEGHFDYPFYKGKVDTARYFVHNIVPNIMTTYNIIMDGDTSAIDIPEEAF